MISFYTRALLLLRRPPCWNKHGAARTHDTSRHVTSRLASQQVEFGLTTDLDTVAFGRRQQQSERRLRCTVQVRGVARSKNNVGCTVDTHGERQPITGVWDPGVQPPAEPLVKQSPPETENLSALESPAKASKIALFSVFCKSEWVELQTGESSTKRDRPLPPVKIIGFASISGTTFGKSGVSLSTPVHPVAALLVRVRSQHICMFIPKPRLVLCHRSKLFTNNEPPEQRASFA